MAKATQANIYLTSVCDLLSALYYYLIIFPCVGDAILSSNLGTSLKGLAIGNGWIDARHQYPAYLDYAVKHALIEENSDVRSSTIPIVFSFNDNVHFSRHGSG